MFGKDTDGPFSFPNERWMKNHMANEHRMKAVKEGGLLRVWQYGLWSFQTGGTKLEKFLPKKQHTQRKLLNFENWVNGLMGKCQQKLGIILESKLI